MPSTYSGSLRLELIGDGEQGGTWGQTTNKNLGTLLEQAVAGFSSVAHDDSVSYTLTVQNGLSDQSRPAMLAITGTLTAARNVVCPSVSKQYVVKNSTTGGFAITFKTAAGSGVSIPNGRTCYVWCDGTNVNAQDYLTGVTLNGTPTLTGATTGTTVGAAGGASSLPATPLGYLTLSINGASVKIPYYNP